MSPEAIQRMNNQKVLKVRCSKEPRTDHHTTVVIPQRRLVAWVHLVSDDLWKRTICAHSGRPSPQDERNCGPLARDSIPERSNTKSYAQVGRGVQQYPSRTRAGQPQCYQLHAEMPELQEGASLDDTQTTRA